MNDHSAGRTTTGFRDWLECISTVRGRRPLWPTILGQALDREFLRQRESLATYASSVFIDRDEHPLADGEREERLVARLYRSALAADGCVTFRRQPIWLLGFQWPTQGGVKEKSRRADLVGLRADGGLVVFEAKVKTGDPPLHAMCEGLDYLACLLRPGNFSKIEKGFQSWSTKRGKTIPQEFRGIKPRPDVRPSLFVLAPEAYYTELYARSVRGIEWPFYCDVVDSFMPSVDVHFAATDFKSPKLWEPKRTKVRIRSS